MTRPWSTPARELCLAVTVFLAQSCRSLDKLPAESNLNAATVSIVGFDFSDFDLEKSTLSLENDKKVSQDFSLDKLESAEFDPGTYLFDLTLYSKDGKLFARTDKKFEACLSRSTILRPKPAENKVRIDVCRLNKDGTLGTPIVTPPTPSTNSNATIDITVVDITTAEFSFASPESFVEKVLSEGFTKYDGKIVEIKGLDGFYSSDSWFSSSQTKLTKKIDEIQSIFVSCLEFDVDKSLQFKNSSKYTFHGKIRTLSKYSYLSVSLEDCALY